MGSRVKGEGMFSVSQVTAYQGKYPHSEIYKAYFKILSVRMR